MKKKIIFILSLLIVFCISSIPVSTQASTGKDVTKTFKDTKKVLKLVNEINDWSGYQYFYLLKSKEKKTVTLSDNNILNIAALNYYEPNLGDYISVTEKGILARTFLLFGKKPGFDSLNTYKDEEANLTMNKNKEYICKLENGGLATVYGDWGTASPKMKLLSVTNAENNSYQVKVKNYLYDAETKKSKDYGISTITVKKSSKADYGYIITGIELQMTK